MVRIACFVAVVGLMPNEAALLRIDVVAIRHLQSMILAFGLPDRLTLVMGNREHIRLCRPAVLDESGACPTAGCEAHQVATRPREHPLSKAQRTFERPLERAVERPKVAELSQFSQRTSFIRRR